MCYFKVVYRCFLFLLIFLYSFSVEAQVSFELPLYFEDAQGNKDTIVIGARIDGSWNENQPFQFGEYEDDSPIDSLLDVRLQKALTSELTKIAILEGDEDCFFPNADMPGILLFAKYPPINVYYDYSIIEENFCFPDRVVFWYNSTILIADPIPIYDPPVIDCLTSNGNIELNYNELLANSCNFCPPNYINTNGDSVRLFRTQMVDSPFQGVWPWWETCEQKVGINDLISDEISIKNPVANELIVNSQEDIKSIELFNCLGRLVLTQSIEHQQSIDVQHLASGIYIAKLNLNNSYLTIKIVKE